MINDLWYKNAVIYCLSVATYRDANGDGIGDFQGADAPFGLLAGTWNYGPSGWRHFSPLPAKTMVMM
jgi:hypothetical protein